MRFQLLVVVCTCVLSNLLAPRISATPILPTPPIFPPSPPSPPSPPIPPEPPTDLVSGKQVYEEQCAICHGMSGEGNARGYPLRHIHKDYGTAITRLGREGNAEFSIPMPAYDKTMLSDLELALVMEFLHGQEKPRDGQQYYMAYCANCHGVDGQGGFSQRPVVHRADRVEPWIRWGSGGFDYRNRRFYMPRWNKHQISDEAVEAIVQFIEKLTQESGN